MIIDLFVENFLLILSASSMELYCVVCIIQLLIYYPREEYNGCITFIEMLPTVVDTKASI